MATANNELGPNTSVRLGVAVGSGVTVCGFLLGAAIMAANARADIAHLNDAFSDSATRQIRIETKVDDLGDKMNLFTRDTISRLATLEAQMKVVQSAQPK